MLESFKSNRRYFAFTVGLLLAVSQWGGLSQDTTYAATDEETAVLAFTSDVHNDQKNYTGETRLGTWIDNVMSRYGKIDAMAFGGDMAQYNSADARFWSETQRVMDVVAGKGVTAYYTTGNHEYDHDSSITTDFYPEKNETTARYIQNDWAVSDDDHNYRIYCMGVGEASGYTYVSNAYTANQVTTLRDKLAAVDNSKPIFIITHFPLHYCSQNISSNSRTIARASDVIDVLNNASDGGTPNDPSDDKKIVFLWGHNHSLNNPNDPHYDGLYQKGSELKYDSSHEKDIKFYYAAAGSMCDTEKDAGSGKIKGKGLVVTVDDNDLLTFTYNDANANDVTEGGSFVEREPVAVTGLSIEEASEAGQPGLDLEAGKKLQLHASIEPTDAADNTVTWSSSETTIATVDKNGRVTGVSEGQATITAQLTDMVSGGTFTAEVIVNVTPRTIGGTPYVLTNQLTPGKNYIITDSNSGDVNALLNDNGTVSRTEITVDGDTIYTDEEDIVFEAQGSGTTVSNLHNGNRYLKASSSGLQLLTTAGESRPWEYDGSNHKLTNYKSSSSSATHYYVYYENNAFASSTSTSSSHVVYLFEETEPDVSYSVTFKVENGKWDDDSTADKTVTVSGPEGSVTLDADQIPAVGNKPDSGYKAGSWDVTPDTTTAITRNVTYTYTYDERGSEKDYVLTDELKVGKKYIITNAGSGTAVALANDKGTASTANVTIDGDTIHTDESSIVFTMEGSDGSVNNISNAGQYLHEGSPVTFSSSGADGHLWTYTDTYLSYESSGIRYDMYYSSSSHNYFRIKAHDGTSSSSHSVYLFEEAGPDIEPTVHDWSKPTYAWSDDNSRVTVEYHCTVTGCTEEVTETAETTSEVTKEATCTEPGETRYTATFEDRAFADQEKTVDTEPAALGHHMEAHAAVEPTCTEAGNYAYFSCDRCNEFFADEAGETEVEENSWVIPAGHDWSKPTYAWSYDNSRVTAEYHCTVTGCAEEVTETAETTSEVTKEATCTEPGETRYTATFEDRAFADQEKTVDTEPAALGHSWDKGKVTRQAAVTATGVRTYACNRCGKTRTETIPKKSAPIIVAKSVAKGKKSMKNSWNNVPGANRYIVYVVKCNNRGGEYSFKKVATLKAGRQSYTKGKLKKNTAYRFKVTAQEKVDGKYRIIATSLVGHCFTGGYQGKYTNPRSVKLNKGSITLRNGKACTIKATVTKLK